MECKTVAEAKNLSGLRLALTVGGPAPWSMAAKSILHVKKIPYVPVAQHGGEANEELLAWTGHRNAPVAVYNNEPPRTGWRISGKYLRNGGQNKRSVSGPNLPGTACGLIPAYVQRTTVVQIH
ncbi:MAG: hypothetical protein FJ147_12545 [Deltaproteobacteria bacterium]|nr:hypothetical protein [Deltaproteobacteria bacterium]